MTGATMENFEFSLPPAPNWYCSHILDVSSHHGLVAYGSKNSIVIVKTFHNRELLKSENSDWRNKAEWRRPKATLCHSAFGDKSKITGVSWSVKGNQLAACSDDGIAKLFSFNQGTCNLACIQTHLTHKDVSQNKSKINAVCWVNESIVATGDDAGNVVIWDTTLNQTRYLSLNRNTILVMRTHPVSESILALGCKLGLALIVNISGKGKIIHKIRAHNEDIQGLDFSPKNELLDILRDEAEPVLAVSCRNRSVSLWSSTTAKQLALLQMPDCKAKVESPWITLKWGSKSKVFVSCAQGEIGCWSLDKLMCSSEGSANLIKADKNDFQYLHHEHQKSAFSLAVHQDCVYSCGYDRSLICFDSEQNEVVFNLPSFASRIVCMATNFVDPSILAIGSGDGQIRVWKTASTKLMFDCTTIWQKLSRCEISALTWHPERENLLAFATNEGRMGFVDALSPRPNPSFLDFKHRGSVYNLCYGPSLRNPDETVLYSLGDGVVFLHKQGQKSFNIEDLLSKRAVSRSNMAFHPNGQYLALGSDDGSVEICRISDHKIVATLKSYQKLIQSLAWHPSTSGSKMDHYLAVASNEYDIHIWNLANVLASDEECILTKPDIVLVGHKLRVITLAWSPYDEDKLLSVSYDGTAQIWAVSEAKPLSNFRGHVNRVFTGIWSPSGEKDLIFTGAEDNMLIGWDITKQPYVHPVKKGSGNSKKEKTSLAELVRDSPEENLEVEPKKEPKEVTTSGEVLKEVSPLKDKSYVKKLNKKAYFPVIMSYEASHKETAYRDIENLMIQDTPNEDLEANPHLSIFSSNNEDIEKALLKEIEAVEVSKPYGDESWALAHWSGDCKLLKAMLEKAAGHLTDFHVTLSASLDHDTWKWACVTYAKQLEEKGNATKASSYYLMAHDLDKAIQVLVNANFHLAAVTLAKSRLPNDHPLIKDLLKQWAHQAIQDGMYELASKCWLGAGFYRESALALSKKSDGHSLRVAAELFMKSGDEDQATVIAFQALDSFAQDCNIEGIKLLSEKIPLDKVQHKISEVLREKTEQ